MTQVHLSMRSNNAKTGPIPVSTTEAKTCPDACPFKRNGCYADGGPLAMHWRAVTQGKRGMAWGDFVAAVAAMPEGQLWRHNQAGDLPGIGDCIDTEALAQLVAANAGRRGFTYTHKPMGIAANREAVKAANDGGFVVNLSANNLTHADELAALECGPVVAVVPEDAPEKGTTPGGRPYVVCPAQTRDDVACATCQLCARGDRRGVVVAFRAHGASKRKAGAIAAQLIA